MTDHEEENAQLAAWLAGDLADAESAALERRLDAEPALGARLDALAATVARLRRYDTVELPADAAVRLHDRLRSERLTPTAGTGTGERGPSQPTTAHDAGSSGQRTTASPGPGGVTRPPGPGGVTRPPGRGEKSGRDGRPGRDVRPGRERAARRARVAGIAAAVLAVVVGIGGLLPLLNRGGGGDSADSAAFEVAAGDEASAQEEALAEGSQEAASELVEEDSASEEERAAGEDTATSAEGAASEEDTAAEEAATAPVVVDAGAPLGLSAAPNPASEGEASAPAAEAALADRFLAVPEARALLELPLDEARVLARSIVAELQTMPALTSVGVAPAACLDTVLPEDTAVPARVEGFQLDGSPALAYVVVRATPGAQALDTIEVAVTDPRTCAVLARV